MKKIKLDDIRIDGGTQIRVVLDQNRVYHYRDCMEEGDKFPAVKATYDGSHYWMYSGFHRYHAYRLLNVKEIDVEVIPGTQREAQYLALCENYDHGLPLSNADKRHKVEMALELEGEEASNYEIAKICRVSQSFVASVRSPEAKERQKANVEKHYKKKVEESENTSSTSTSSTSNRHEGEPDPRAGEAPDEDEIRAAELAQQADMEMMYKILESDDALNVVVEENKRLNLLNAQLDTRIRGLMNEKNECIKQCKKLQKELDKLKGK